MSLISEGVKHAQDPELVALEGKINKLEGKIETLEGTIETFEGKTPEAERSVNASYIDDKKRLTILEEQLTELRKEKNLIRAFASATPQPQGKRVSYQGQPSEDIFTFSLPILNLVDGTDQKCLSGLSFSMDYTRFNIALTFAVGANKCVKLYCLPDYRRIYENISEKEKVTEENFEQVIKKVYCALSKSDVSNKRPTLFFFVIPPEIDTPFSPDQDWLESNKPVQLKVSRSLSSRTSEDQTNSRTAAMARDGQFCLFCEKSELVSLEGAHIFDVERYEVRMNIKQFGILSINEVNNFFILCKPCHTSYDHQMMCIDPESRKLVITEAFLACSPLKEQYLPLQQKSILPPDDPVLLNHYPPVALLKYRWRLFNETNNLRRERNKEYPFYCVTCSKRWKTQNGYNNHLCKDAATAHH